MNGDIATLTTGLPQNLTTVFSSLKRYFVHWDYQKQMQISFQMTFRNGRPKASFNILVIRKNSNLAVTFINRTKPEKNSNFPQYFCHRKGSATTIYEFSLWLPGIRRTRYRISCRLLFWVLVPTHVSPFVVLYGRGFSLLLQRPTTA